MKRANRRATFRYAEAMEEIQCILERLERGEVELDELYEEVRRAQRLIRRCREYLRRIESDVHSLLEEEE